MHHLRRLGSTIILMAGLLGAAWGADSPELRALARQVNAAFRALDNLSIQDDLPAVEAKVQEADALIEKVRALNPNYAEIQVWQNKSRGWKKQIQMARPAADAPTGDADAPPADGGAPAKVAPAAGGSPAPAAPASGTPGKAEVKADWQAFLDYCKDFQKKYDAIFNVNGQVMYQPDTLDAVLAKLEQLRRADVPEARRRLEAFGGKYGRDTDTIDRRLFELTPENTRKSRLDPENQRPDGSAGQCYRELERMLKLIAQGPVDQAAGILAAVRNELQNTSGKTDSVYARLETQLRAAQRLDPNNAAIGSELAAFGKQRAGLQAAAAERLKTAKFPAHAGNFAGPGDPKALTAAAIRYFNEVYPKEKAIAASVAGNWVSTKKNLLGQTIQWGLPVYVASIQNNSKEICRVFKMTVLAAEGNSPPKAPPFVDHWTGDSYQMLIANVPRN
jgi:hypothetical protein